MSLGLEPILEDEVNTDEQSETEDMLPEFDYKPFCSFCSLEIAVASLFGECCSSLCNESCLFCLTRNTLEPICSNYNTHWYRFINKSSQSIVKLKNQNSHVILFVSRNSIDKNFKLKDSNFISLKEKTFEDDLNKKSTVLNEEPIYLIRI